MGKCESDSRSFVQSMGRWALKYLFYFDLINNIYIYTYIYVYSQHFVNISSVYLLPLLIWNFILFFNHT